MGFNLEIRVAARIDIQEAINWYEKKQVGLGKTFVSEFRNTLKYIIENPAYFRRLGSSFREAKIRKFPFLVIYRIDKDKIIIFSVFNTHQKPSKKP